MRFGDLSWLLKILLFVGMFFLRGRAIDILNKRYAN